MKRTLLLIVFMSFSVVSLFGQQQFQQYFDGADTIFDPGIPFSSLFIEIDTSSTNIWQIGSPQKPIFNAAATLPNVLVTDTINFYPLNNSSSFQFTIVPWTNWGILAMQWKQKLDMDQGLDGGKIEFSVDAGFTWQNAFNNPHVYNFYGFLPTNQDTLLNGDFVLSGSDSAWKDIWLCYDMTWLSFNDSIMVRFTFLSDSIDNESEGWMIDNFLIHVTILHTVGEEIQEEYLKIYPNPATDIIYIQTKKIRDFHIIKQMTLVNSLGQTVDEWKNKPTKFFIDTRKYPNGFYNLKIETNIKTETIPIIIQHH